MNKIKQIIAQMTLEEKAGLCSGQDFWHLKAIERLGVPSTMVSDGPHGLRKQNEQADHLGINESIAAVCFPAACATASSFDEALLYEVGAALGEECRAQGVSVLLGPAVNIKRSPLCGRNFEYFSEDPYLTGKLSAAQIKGVQSWDVGTSLKHYAANNQEYRRMTSSSEIDARTLREIYLAGFEIAVKEAKPWTLMCSYNQVNGVFASESKQLLTDILRDEWGFEGYVMSDWGAVNNRVAGLAAGLELEMPASGGTNDAKIVQAVSSGVLPLQVLDTAVERMLSIVLRYVDSQRTGAQFDLEKHHALAIKAATQSAVLLKNSGVLPLARTASIAYLGGFAKQARFQGGGSSHINAFRTESALEAATNQIEYEQGFSTHADEMDDAALARAVAVAKAAQVAVIFAGLPDSFESEGYDRSHMRLPQCQNKLIAAVAAVQPNTVVVLHNGSPVEMPWHDQVSAILELYLGGQGVGKAADALLYGDANPSGRLAESFPLRLEDNPSHLNFPGDGHTAQYAEGVFVGYRYYDKKNMPVLFPFGHGLSYTSFAYKNAQLSQPLLQDGGCVTVSVEVTNTGAVAGSEVVQLYTSADQGVQRPVKELRGFAKLALLPGETKTVTLALTQRDFCYYDTRLGDWYAPSGAYTVLLGHSSASLACSLPIALQTARCLPFTVTENTTVGDLLADARTAPAMQQRVSAFLQSKGAQPSANSKAAISDEMVRQMMQNAPLRALKSFNGMTDEQLGAMIAGLNTLL